MLCNKRETAASKTRGPRPHKELSRRTSCALLSDSDECLL